METKIKPATPLPWMQDPTGDCGPGWIGVPDANYFVATDVEIFEDAAYLVHAANAYPKLVEALRLIDQANNGPWDGAEQKRYVEHAQANASALLRELGEAS